VNDEPRERDNTAERVRAEERHRLALYLHDSIGQILCLTKLQLSRIQDALRQPLDADRQAWLQTTVDALIPEMDTAMHAIQEKLFDLDVTVLADVGLAAALEQECAAFIRRTGISCERRFEALVLDAERGALVVLILREALANIARHSRATSAEVTLQQSGQQGILSVRDNGIGFDPIRMRAAESFGVREMEDRARTLRGELNFTSKPNEGSQITLSFPLDLH
jgi:signal transduction histidine kinase